ncbi:pyridoxamine 5'-phosphate oxidase family protein [uncultured Piscinibacter sp.]|uniref:pyridoxamine 5'-phosphate oxidase family protein n=1 Tax=uncultured Piscinibacter sp. TaxID=1131835 RepID=UPI002633194A|nr:pyridoxamine 5'-phosphate oxidase family protein [uncultured Piscinibacter sp.]
MSEREAARRTLRRLLDSRAVAALATLHRGEPAVSMVPFVLPAGDTALILHVSALATHTRDMQEHARVGLLVMAEPDATTAPQALPRISLQAEARTLARDTAEHAAARAAYLARFPDAAVTFELADFALVALQPLAARLVAGFGRADALAGEALVAWLRG